MNLALFRRQLNPSWGKHLLHFITAASSPRSARGSPGVDRTPARFRLRAFVGLQKFDALHHVYPGTMVAYPAR